MAAERRVRRLAPEALLPGLLAALRARRLSDSLLEQQARVLPRFFGFLAANRVRDVRAVGEAHVIGYLRALKKSKTRYGRRPAPATVLLHLLAIRRFFRFLVRRKRLLHDPSLNVALPRHDPLPRNVLTVSQARRLMNPPFPDNPRWWAPHVEQRDRAVLELLYGTGIRRGECLRLQVADLDLRQGQLLVRNGKGRKDRFVPLPMQAAKALDLYLSEARPELASRRAQGALFLSYQTGRRFSSPALGVMLKTRARAAGIKTHVHPHALRHTCATHLLEGGADVRQVQELLGHADIQSTTRYTRVAVKDLRRIIERCHPRERQRPR